MNLDLLLLGWLHLVASVGALAAGALVLVRPKGTATHKLHGRIFVAALVVVSLTALGIYRIGRFFFPHWLAVAALICVTVGFAAAHFRWPRTGWKHLHLTSMLASLYLLVGGGVNEAFLRVRILRELVPSFSSPAVGLTHFAVMLVFAGLIAWFNASVLMRKSGLPDLRIK